MYKILITSSNDNKMLNDLAKTLLKEKLSPCLNIVDDVNSFYFWDSKSVDSNESLLLIKCMECNIENIKKIIKKIHNYDAAEIISIDFNIISKEYEDWFRKESR